LPPADRPPRRRASIRDAARTAAARGGEIAPGGEPGRSRPSRRAGDPGTGGGEARGAAPADPGGAPEAAPFDTTRTLGEWLEALVPPEAQVHFLNAGREFASGVQVTLDHHLGRGETPEKSPGTVRIEIE
jgi:hypothetical protein